MLRVSFTEPDQLFAGVTPPADIPPAFGPEVQAVLDRMTGLTDTETAAIARFVQEEVNNGNWNLYDEFYCFALSGANALTGFIAKTATNNGAVLSVEGAETDGIATYINTNFNPAIDGVNYVQDDAMGSLFVISPIDPLSFDTAMGARIAGTNHNVYLAAINNAGRFGAQVNTSLDASYLSDLMKANTLYSITRDGASSSRNIYINGVGGLLSVDRASEAIASQPVYIGALNADGSPGLYGEQTAATAIFGGAVGFDQAAHYTNQVAFLTELGTLP